MLLRTVKKGHVIFVDGWELKVVSCYDTGVAIVCYRGDTLRLTTEWTAIGPETHVAVSEDREFSEREVRLAFDAPRSVEIHQP